jgi:tetratricopeptide (TPR) repeat protein
MATSQAKRFITVLIIFGALVVYGVYRPIGPIAGPSRWERDSAEGVRCLQENRLVDAERFFLTALQRAKSDNDFGRELGTSLQNLGDLRSAQLRFGDAEQYYSQALSALDADARTPQGQIAALLTSYAAALSAEGNYAQAEPLVRRAISIPQNARDSRDPALATNYVQLAAVHALMNRTSSAATTQTQSAAEPPRQGPSTRVASTRQ